MNEKNILNEVEKVAEVKKDKWKKRGLLSMVLDGDMQDVSDSLYGKLETSYETEELILRIWSGGYSLYSKEGSLLLSQ